MKYNPAGYPDPLLIRITDSWSTIHASAYPRPKRPKAETADKK